MNRELATNKKPRTKREDYTPLKISDGVPPGRGGTRRRPGSKRRLAGSRSGRPPPASPAARHRKWRASSPDWTLLARKPGQHAHARARPHVCSRRTTHIRTDMRTGVRTRSRVHTCARTHPHTASPLPARTFACWSINLFGTASTGTATLEPRWQRRCLAWPACPSLCVMLIRCCPRPCRDVLLMPLPPPCAAF